MRNSVFVLIFVAFLFSCTSTSINTDDLPKDVALKPQNENPNPDNSNPSTLAHDITEKTLQDLRTEIEDIINSESCADASQWRISPLGSKPCGGPVRYIAYPKSKENQILSKIQAYNAGQSAYNKAKGLTSDCSVPATPTGIICKNNVAVLTYDNGASQ